MAAGAFLGGLILAEGEFSHQVHADVRPLRDLLASLFFVSVGMLIDVRAMAPVLPMVLVVAVGVVTLKVAVAFGALAVTCAPPRVALASAVALAQIGEFSFLLGRAALDGGVITQEWWQVLLGASILTMAATPFLIGAAPDLAAWMMRGRGGAPSRSTRNATAQGPRRHPRLRDWRTAGRAVARRVVGPVRRARTEWRDRPQRARERGVNIHYADVDGAGAARSGRGRASGCGRGASQRSRRIGARNQSGARTQSARFQSLQEHGIGSKRSGWPAAGATLAVAEELEASLEVLSQFMMRLHIPGNVVETLVDNYRRVLGTLDGACGARAGSALDQMPKEIIDAPVSSFRLGADAWAAGHSLQELNLRAQTGATVLAVRRGGSTTTSPRWVVPASGTGRHVSAGG